MLEQMSTHDAELYARGLAPSRLDPPTSSIETTVGSLEGAPTYLAQVDNPSPYGRQQIGIEGGPIEEEGHIITSEDSYCGLPAVMNRPALESLRAEGASISPEHTTLTTGTTVTTTYSTPIMSSSSTSSKKNVRFSRADQGKRTPPPCDITVSSSTASTGTYSMYDYGLYHYPPIGYRMPTTSAHGLPESHGYRPSTSIGYRPPSTSIGY